MIEMANSNIRGMFFGLYLDNSDLYLVDMFYAHGKVIVDLYDPYNGQKRGTFTSSLSLPPHDKPTDYGIFGPPPHTLDFKTLADTDNDGYWNALVTVADYVLNLHLPLAVHKKYNPFAPLPFRNINNAAPIYELE